MDATLTTPLELLGSHAGLSVVDPGTILTRLWYFDGKFLRAAGFRLDQQYVRSLVALSNQATGSGVVHGFDASRAAGDRLHVEAGLALAPSGRVVYLPTGVDLAIAELVARSTGGFDPSTPHEPGTADFGRCPPEGPAGPDVTVAATPVYVLTVSGIEALCGEEERFGQLCEDACATETDRSTVVEGVCFRLRELQLTLPTSRVPFGSRHLRSRVAAAYFELERRAVPSLVSGAGLRSAAWCQGADAVGGEEVPIAVLDRSGAVTSFVDVWTARRELTTPTPERYWQWRMAMRPWDAFLAQLLQFQCQLLDLGAGGGGGGGPDDPCAAERATLAAVGEVLGELAQQAPGEVDARARTAFAALSPDALSRVEALRAKVAAALEAGPVAGSGSLLFDGGIWDVPPAGYLPVSTERDVAEQVGALFGPGVDLRFCAVRPDFVPEALLEAQHMERISLTRGIDDPEAVEEVDVLVPGGVVEEAATAVGDAFTGVVRVVPRRRPEARGAVEGSALSLSAVARSSSGAGWSWVLAAYGEAPQLLSVPDLMRAFAGEAGRAFAARAAEAHAVDVEAEGEAGGGEDDGVAAARREANEVFVRPDAEHDERRRSPAFVQRLRREASAAGARRARAVSMRAQLSRGDEIPVEPDRPLRDDEDRPVAVWVDGSTDAPLDAVPVNGSTVIRARGTLYSRAATSPVLFDARLLGSLRVVDVVDMRGRRAIHTVLDGSASVFRTGDVRPDVVPVHALQVTWTTSVAPTGTRNLSVTVGDPFAGVAAFVDSGDPRRITGELSWRTTVGLRADDWQAASRLARFTPPLDAPREPFATLELDEEAGALATGSEGRAVAESVISILAAELSARGADPAFTAYATGRLLEGTGGGTTRRITATADWVLFHRRRTRVCTDDVVERPQRTRTYRLYHRRAPDPELGPFEALRGRIARSVEEVAGIDPRRLDERARRVLREAGDIGFVRSSVAVDDLGFEPVATLEFREGEVDLASPVSALRASWQAADRGNRLLLAAVGDLGEGDGETVALGRLAAVRSAVADLIDVSRARVEHLLDVPPEFRETGIDGVMLTVGTLEVERTCMTVYRLSPEEHKRVLDQLERIGEEADISVVVQKADVSAEVFTVFFEDGRIVDEDAVVAGWEQFDVMFAVLGLPSSTDPDEAQRREDLARRFAEAIRAQDFSDDVRAARSDSCPAVLLVAVRERDL